ncbi:MAG: FAD-dependent oxidoreductase [Nitrospirae bacterium]|nr:FAD-dependent oxidoreductase [Nitrospirota bacterium]
MAIIGAGPGGYVAAIRAAQLGARVSLVTGGELGEACLQRGCIPTKALIASIETLHKVRTAEEFGIEIPGVVSWSLKKMVARKDRVVHNLSKGIWGLLTSWGVDLIEGRGRLTRPTEVEVSLLSGGVKVLSADKIILATGSEPSRRGIFPVDGVKVINSDEALILEEAPKSLIVVGAGVVGCEFASIFQELGTKITLVEVFPRVLPGMDEEVAGTLEREFKKKGIQILTGSKIRDMQVGDDGEVKTRMEGGARISTEKALICVGREFNVAGLGLEDLGVRLGDKGNIQVDSRMETNIPGDKGNIQVDSRMETNIPGIFAVGDVTGGIMLAHVASAQGIIAVENAMGHNKEMDYRVIPAGIFTIPEIGCVGLTERQAQEMGVDTHIGRFLFRGLGKAHATGDIVGMVKIIADARTEKIVGVHIIGSQAADLIHESAFAIKMGASMADLADTVHAHPTLSEAVKEAAEDGLGMAVHLPKKK